VALLMLAGSRARRASLAKLHVMNYAVRSPRARDQLTRILDGTEPPLNWQMRVEPAFGRAIDFMVGEHFAVWSRVAGRTGLELTDSGAKAVLTITRTGGVLADEKPLLTDLGRRLTEQFVSRLLAAGRNV
jgi:hypothetical protein